MVSNLSQTLQGINFKNPVAMLAGNAGFGTEYTNLHGFDYGVAGAVFLKGTTLEARAGNKDERVIESAAGMLNSIGLQNPGVDAVIANYLPHLDFSQTNFIPNVCGSSLQEYQEVCKKFDDTEVCALEINISCPNVREGGAIFGNDVNMSAKVVQSCRQVTDKKLIVKLSPNQTDIVTNTRAVIEAGADMISAINTISAMSIDINTKKPRLGNNFGGLSGPAIKPIALLKIYQIYQITKKLNIPIIGQGGIFSWQDAIEFILAGASVVGVGTMLAKDPCVVPKINKGIQKYMNKNGINDIKKLVGKLELNI